MAGLPKEVIRRASEILNYHLQNHTADDKVELPVVENQLSVFSAKESELKQDLSDLDVLSISPLDAIRKLDELKKKHGL